MCAGSTADATVCTVAPRFTGQTHPADATTAAATCHHISLAASSSGIAWALASRFTPCFFPTLRRVYLVPPSTCGFVGLGYIGCDGSYTCRAWIGAGFWASPAAIAHELGHNLFLNHANSINTEGVIEE